MKEYENNKKEIKQYFDVSDNQKITKLCIEECFDDIIKTKNEFETSFNVIDNGLNNLICLNYHLMIKNMLLKLKK